MQAGVWPGVPRTLQWILSPSIQVSPSSTRWSNCSPVAGSWSSGKLYLSLKTCCTNLTLSPIQNWGYKIPLAREEKKKKQVIFIPLPWRAGFLLNRSQLLNDPEVITKLANDYSNIGECLLTACTWVSMILVTFKPYFVTNSIIFFAELGRTVAENGS